MSVASQEVITASRPGSAPSSLRVATRYAIALGGYWGLLLWNLSGHWATNPNYAFGWIVPGLAIILLFQPGAAPASPSEAKHRNVARIIMTGAALAFLPTWILAQPNPDWRFVSWCLAFEAEAITLAALYLDSGPAVARRYAFAILFVLTAVPWPFGIEYRVTQGLTRLVVAVVVDGLNILGFGAVAHGNLIELHQGILDVTDTCSGIKSFQAACMAALFLGKFYRLRIPRRGLLVLAAASLAIVCNIVRALILGWLAGEHGVDALEAWHDPAGWYVLIVCFIALWFIAVMIGQPAPVTSTVAAQPDRARIFDPLSIRLAAWCVVLIIATEAWYRFHEAKPQLTWDFRWPVTETGFEERALPKHGYEMLRYDSGRAAVWTAKDGTQRAAYFLKWNPGASRLQIPARSHDPSVCLPAMGYTYHADGGQLLVSTGRLDIPFEHYLFSESGQPVDVFFCIWEDRPADLRVDSMRFWSRSMGVLFALNGQRRISQQVLELAYIGYKDPSQAAVALRKELPRMIAEGIGR